MSRVKRKTCRDVGGIYDDGTMYFKCSWCGCMADLDNGETKEPTMWKDGKAIVPAFCPACGREIID